MGNGFNNINDYVISGLPWVTSSIISSNPTRLDFPKATRSITVRNLGASDPISVGFTRNGVQSGFKFNVPQGTSQDFSVRSKVLFLVAPTQVSCSVYAELTTIDAKDVPLLTGSTSGDAAGTSWTGIG